MKRQSRSLFFFEATAFSFADSQFHACSRQALVAFFFARYERRLTFFFVAKQDS